MSPFPQRAAAMLCMCATFGVLTTSRLSGFALIGDSWPAGSDIVMHLSLSRAATGFQDGSASWNASAANALRIWNEHLGTVRFVEGGSVAAGNGDSVNSVFFSSSVYGEKFGTNTIAVTVGFNDATNPAIIVETDVIFNTAERWNSYRGPVQFDSGGKPIYDLHRVALHEFGHVFGLDHPDQKGQPDAHALMNSAYGDNDALTDDDIAGAQHLYGYHFTSPVSAPPVPIGERFTYQTSTNIQPLEFSASGLPAGLQIDPNSGLISGIPTLSGNYSIEITARWLYRSMTLVLQLQVVPQSNTTSAFVNKFPFESGELVLDAIRRRIYATVPATKSIVVIDTDTLAVVKMIELGTPPISLAISPDGATLWVATNIAGPEAICAIDLNTFDRLPGLALPYAPSKIVAGLAGRLYVTTANDTQGIMQVNAVSGTVHPIAASGTTVPGYMQLSADRHTLFWASASSPARIQTFDVSQDTAVALQRRDLGSGYGGGLQLNRAGDMLVYGSEFVDGRTASLAFSATDLQSMRGRFISPSYSVDRRVFSADDAVLYQTSALDRKLTIFDTATFSNVGAIDLMLPGDEKGTVAVADMICDPTGAYIFASMILPPRAGELRVYRTGRYNRAAENNAASKKLRNVSTRLLTHPGENMMIGGFIVTGDQPKRLAIRAIGTSLPVAGRLSDPMLKLYDSAGQLIAQNDNWNSDRNVVLQSQLAPTDEHESAIVSTLNPGAYTASVEGVGSSSGVGLVEVYDLTPETGSALGNISTRGRVETGDNVMIGGFIIGGDDPMSVIVRAIGPSLLQSGVTGALQDTTLDLHDGNGALLASNDDWRDSEEEEIEATTVPPIDSRESAIVKTLAPGNYTAIVRGKNESTGVALVEVYSLASP